MPRRENIETKIIDYFREKPLDQVNLVFRVVRHIMRKREKNRAILVPAEDKEKTA